jgi:5-formyltetrahydrofolate cyclo-ligase
MKALRDRLRAARAALPPETLAAHARAASALLWRLPVMARAQDIACYWAVPGEVDCGPIMAEAWSRGRRLYLPVLQRNHLVFAAWHTGEPLTANRYGIPEPSLHAASCRRAQALDVVIAPLVAFDAKGSRLGMGGGYYDRTLGFTRSRGRWRLPHFIGLAHELQCVARLPRQAWDIPLHAVVTERSVRLCSDGSPAT